MSSAEAVASFSHALLECTRRHDAVAAAAAAAAATLSRQRVLCIKKHPTTTSHFSGPGGAIGRMYVKCECLYVCGQ